MSGPALLWLGRDLRLADNPALIRATAGRRPVLALYVLDETIRPPGRGQRWWLRQSLAALEKSLSAHGIPLVLDKGDPARVLPKIAEEIGAEIVAWNRRPEAPESDARVEKALQGREVFIGSGALLTEPGQIRTGTGGAYQVFGPFWRACRASDPARPQRIPDDLAGVRQAPRGTALDALFPKDFEPAGDWRPGEEHAREQLSNFLDEGMSDYPTARDIPSVAGTSLASPRLASGEVSPRQIWQATLARMAHGKQGSEAGEVFLRELGWREFSYGILADHPDMATRPLREAFERFPWRKSKAEFDAWRAGQTGYPLIDASMRALKTEGWLHNRMRMVVASFLVKHLLLPWQDGEQWFWDVLVDADPANNPANWQWVAGCGMDAAPYFRIFNPMLQGKRFDPGGDYVRAWVPELAQLPEKHIHAPWEAPADVLRRAGVELGKTYPMPIVEHAGARQRALAALATIRQQPSPSHS